MGQGGGAFLQEPFQSHPAPEIAVLHLFLVLSLAASDVLDVGSTHACPDVQSAVYAAQSGDVIRIEDGTYPYFGVFNKSLRIVARHDNGNVRIDGTVRIQEIAAGQEVLVEPSTEGARRRPESRRRAPLDSGA